MADLATWLLAQLDADEATARDAGPCHQPDHELYVMDDDYRYPLVVGPRWVLADVAAKRLLVELHRPMHEEDWHGNRVAGDCVECDTAVPCDTVRLLASAYRHRPGFDPSWLPEETP